MKALCWMGKHEVGLRNVKEPTILNPHDAIIKVTSAAICGSDLHLYNGTIPHMEKGDILGHETMGEVVAVGSQVKNIKLKDRVVIPFDIACGSCRHCEAEEYSACDNTNPNSVLADKLYGHSGSGLFGYSHLYGGYAGGQAEYLRVPFIDTNSILIPEEIPDEKVLFLSDILPTGYMAAENCNIKPGDTVAVWGAGPVAQMAIRCAYLMKADRVIAIDHFEKRLEMASKGKAHTINFESVDSVLDELSFLTGGRGPDSCIDAVGMEAHGHSITATLDRAKMAVGLATDRPDALRQAIQACKKGGTISIPGVYGGVLDKMPFGAAFGKGLTFKMGQTHTQKYMPILLSKIMKDEIDPSFVITHRIDLENAPKAYQQFNDEKNECIKVVINMH